ncbi:MAG: alpha-L-fucosidase [Anaerolineae bacterium]
MNESEYFEMAAKTRPDRIKWWQEARFGMFIHWGLYSQLARHEWVMNRERIPIPEYEPLADSWHPKERPAREWARLARDSGMKYMVMTSKHHEGFLLWDSKLSDYNAVKHGPGRDLVAEYVDACHEFGLRCGLYYSLMDWHHPDGANCAHDDAARRRFLDYTQGLVRELCTNYGKLDILWYDVSWPLRTPAMWESAKMNAMVRELQPDILINNRSQLDEDFGTPEEEVRAAEGGRNWEACMTFNGSWGYMPSAVDWHPTREVLGMLRTATAGQGNLLLNIGPMPDGTVPPEAYERLEPLGKWLKLNGEAVYGTVNNANHMEWMPTGQWTIKGSTAYYWCNRWPGKQLTIGGLQTKLQHACLLATGESLCFNQEDNRLMLYGLPDTSPDPYAGVAVFKLEFEDTPRQKLGAGCVIL